MKRSRPDREPPSKPRGPVVSGSSKDLSLDASALAPFVGQLIESPDTQVKAAAMRFLAASSLSPAEGGGNELVVSLPRGGGDRVITAAEVGSYAQAQARVSEIISTETPSAAASDPVDEDDDDEPYVRVRVPAASVVSPTFNRMAGIQEWENGVALFVNVDGDAYENLFVVDADIDLSAREESVVSDGNGARARGSALFMTFDAPPRAHRGSPIVRRLLSTLRDTILLPMPRPASSAVAASGSGSGSGTGAVEVPVSAALGGLLSRARAAAADDLAAAKEEAAAAAAAGNDDSDDDDVMEPVAPPAAAASAVAAAAEWGVRPIHNVVLLTRFSGGDYRYLGRLRLVAASNLRSAHDNVPAAGSVRFTFQVVDAPGLGPVRREIVDACHGQQDGARGFLLFWKNQDQEQEQEQYQKK